MHSLIHPLMGITLVHVVQVFLSFCLFLRRLMQFTWCLRTLRSQAWKACLVFYHTIFYISTQYIINYTHTHTHLIFYIVFIYQIRCYFVCTNNRIRSPRLAAFGRIEIRWVREVGKFGPYLRYKDWLRRWKYLYTLKLFTFGW